MARVERVVLGSLGVGLLFVFLNGLRWVGPQASQSTGGDAKGLEGVPAAEVQGREPASGSPAAHATAPGSKQSGTESTVEVDVPRFVELLGKLRANDDSVVPEMREVAERLCSIDGRCDGKDILAFYLSMSPDDRQRGLEEQTRVASIIQRTWQRWHDGPLDEDWAAMRDSSLDELRAIAERSGRQPDLFPGACALSFCSRVEMDRLIGDQGLEEQESHDLLVAARGDALASLAAFEKCGMLIPRLEPLWVIGYLHDIAGDGDRARSTFDECLALAIRLRKPDWQEKALQGMVDLAKEAGDLNEIALLLNELASFRTPDKSWYLVREQALLLLRHDLGHAASEFLLAHPLQHPAADLRDRREWNFLLGTAYVRQGNLDAAREQYALARLLPFSRDVALGMASIDLRAGNAERVLEQLSKPEFLQGVYAYEKTLVLELRGEAAMKLSRDSEAVESLERALTIGGELQGRLAAKRDLIGASTNVVGDLVGLHALALLAEARSRLGDPFEAARSIETWQSQSLRRATGAPVEITAQNLRSWASSTDLGLVTWVVGSDSSVVAHVAPDGDAKAVAIPRGMRAIEAAVRRLLEATRSLDGAHADGLAARIWAEILPPPIASRIRDLRGSGRNRLLFLAHGPLERLPIEFLFRDEGVIPLVLPGLPAGEPGTRVTPLDLSRWSVLGGPVDSAGRELLPGANLELAAIAALHGAVPDGTASDADAVQAGDTTSSTVRFRVGSAFDRPSFLAALEDRLPLHVATHLRHGCGRAEGRLADIGLLLSGGDVICARQIRDRRPRLPLAVLDACETAEGRFVDAEGLQGVARAFLESGTRNLLVTLWPVEDQAARRFAEAFHRGLLVGRLPSEAAAGARADLRAAGFPAADWAAFRLIGRD